MVSDCITLEETKHQTPLGFSPAHHPLTAGQACCFTSMSLSFFICKMETIKPILCTVESESTEALRLKDTPSGFLYSPIQAEKLFLLHLPLGAPSPGLLGPWTVQFRGSKGASPRARSGVRWEGVGACHSRGCLHTTPGSTFLTLKC